MSGVIAPLFAARLFTNDDDQPAAKWKGTGAAMNLYVFSVSRHGHEQTPLGRPSQLRRIEALLLVAGHTDIVVGRTRASALPVTGYLVSIGLEDLARDVPASD